MSEYLNEVANATQSYNAKKQKGREVSKIKMSESVRASIAALTAAKINGFINENNELKQEIIDQKRQLDDKVKLIKLTDKANSAMSLEISDLKARQVVVAAYAEQRISMLNKANKVLKSNLQSVKADAVKTYVDSFDGNSETKVYLSWVKKDGMAYANILREGK